jgi:putative transposase
MNPPKCKETDYIDFIIAAPRQITATEAARVQPEQAKAPAHDAFTRLLQRIEPDAKQVWYEAETQVRLKEGILVIDDSTLDKPYARHIGLVGRHWSGKHHAVVSGINLITLLWTDGDRAVPTDYRVFDKAKDRLSKNDHFSEMIRIAKDRGFCPGMVCFDSWYASTENLKLITAQGWRFLTRLKSNRLVNADKQGLRHVSEIGIPESGRVVWLKGFGLIKVFRIAAKDGTGEHWATSSAEMSDLERLKYAGYAWQIEHYHRGIKQYCLIERAQVRSGRAWRNHICLCLRAFLRIESHCYYKGISWVQAKMDIIRDAVRSYISNPLYSLVLTPTA